MENQGGVGLNFRSILVMASLSLAACKPLAVDLSVSAQTGAPLPRGSTAPTISPTPAVVPTSTPSASPTPSPSAGTTGGTTNSAPIVTSQVRASPTPLVGPSLTLSTLASDDGGEGALTYSWSTQGTPPGNVAFTPSGTNASKKTVATFSKAGTYTVLATIQDAPGLTTSSSLTLTLPQVLSAVSLSAPAASVVVGGTLAISAVAKDQFGSALATQPTLTWSVQSGAGSVSSSGVFTAASSAGTSIVRASSGSVGGTLTVTVTAPGNTWQAPLSISADRRYLVDANNKPFPLLLEAAWGSMIRLSPTNFQSYLSDRLLKGFNGIEVWAVGSHPGLPNAPFDFQGNLPFLKRLDGGSWSGALSYGNISQEAPDFTTPNEAYWVQIDQKISALESAGMMAAMFPAYNGYQGEGSREGWMQEMDANGAAKLKTYGAWIADRYKSRGNIIWMIGGDYGAGQFAYTSAQKAVEEALVQGLTSVNGVSKNFSNEWSGSSSGSDIQSVSQALFGALTLNAAYSWNPAGSGLYNQTRNSYAFSDPVRPAFVQESIYEWNIYNPGSTPWRQYSWIGVLNTIGGYTFGNERIWPFSDGTWQNELNGLGSRSASVLNWFVRSIPWSTLVPSGLGGKPSAIVSGGGSTDDDRVSVAVSADRSLLVAYVGPAHSGSFSIDMTALSAPSRARWMDPGNGNFTQDSAQISNTCSSPDSSGRCPHAFSPPGTNVDGYKDWVLVLDQP